MADQEKIAGLQKQIDLLLHQHQRFEAEIRKLQKELANLSIQPEIKQEPALFKQKAENPFERLKVKAKEEILEIPIASSPLDEKKKEGTNWEQYIGGNLINKIGIIILLLGLGLSVKYAIDKGLFPPTVRVIMGFIAGLVLVFLSQRLHRKYETYSAVLFSGGMATLYFTAFLANSFFHPAILPLLPAFILMVLFTVATVSIASFYSSEIIGLLGMVGAYAVPFLLDDGSGNYLIFFAYISIINFGILGLAVLKKWRIVVYSAFVLTWFIFTSWLFSGYSFESDATIAWLFSSLNFAILFLALNAYAFRRNPGYSPGNIILTTVNSLLFYSICYYLTQDTFGSPALGTMTFLFAAGHFALCYWLFAAANDRRSYQTLAALGVFFLTIAIPTQFDMEPAILLWVVETLILFYISKRFEVREFGYFSLILGGISLLTLFGHWNSTYYYATHKSTPVFINLAFFTHLGVLAGTVGFYYLIRHFPSEDSFSIKLSRIVKIIAVVLLAFLFFNQIIHWFQHQTFVENPKSIFVDGTWIHQFQMLWLTIYLLVSVAIISFVNLKLWKDENVANVLFITGAGLIALFFLYELGELNQLRSDFITQKTNVSVWFIFIRYICYLSIILAFIGIGRNLQLMEYPSTLSKFTKLLPHLLAILILSCELVTVILLVQSVENSPHPYREGFSILWGLYSFLLIGIGIFKKSQILRVAGMALFGVTLVKVFLLDLSDLNILSRTLIFIGLGALLMITSFLYQRYRDTIKV